jgi:hypothetical protein
MSEDSTLDPLEVIGELTAALEGARTDLQSLRDELKSVREDSEARDAELAESGRRDRRRTTAVIISVCLDLLITAAFAWNTIRVNNAEDATHASNLQQCQLANVTRQQDIAIWRQFLADLAPAAAGTPKAAAELAEVNALVKVKDTPRDCTSAYAGK